MMSSGANYLGLYGQSPRHAAALYTDARDSLRQASSTSAAARRRSMQPASPASSASSYDTLYEEPRRSNVAPNTSTPPPPYSTRASVLPETFPAAALVASHIPAQEPTSSSSNSTSNSPSPTSRSQKRRSSVMIRDIGMRIFHAK